MTTAKAKWPLFTVRGGLLSQKRGKNERQVAKPSQTSNGNLPRHCRFWHYLLASSWSFIIKEGLDCILNEPNTQNGNLIKLFLRKSARKWENNLKTMMSHRRHIANLDLPLGNRMLLYSANRQSSVKKQQLHLKLEIPSVMTQKHLVDRKAGITLLFFSFLQNIATVLALVPARS